MAKARFSTTGLHPERAIDVNSLSNIAKRYVDARTVAISTAAGQTATAVFTQNATVKHSLGPVGQAGTLKAAYISQTTLAAGGTLAWHLVAYDASANAEVVLTATLDPEAATVREAQTFTLAATNVALDADDTLELHCVASDAVVSQDARGVRVTMVFEPSESDSQVDR